MASNDPRVKAMILYAPLGDLRTEPVKAYGGPASLDTVSRQQQLKAANKNLEYVLLPDITGGKMDAAAHQFRGREEEVFRITLDWLKKHRLGSWSSGRKLSAEDKRALIEFLKTL